MTRASAPLSGNDRRAEPGTHQITTKDPGVTPRRAGVPLFERQSSDGHAGVDRQPPAWRGRRRRGDGELGTSQRSQGNTVDVDCVGRLPSPRRHLVQAASRGRLDQPKRHICTARRDSRLRLPGGCHSGPGSNPQAGDDQASQNGHQHATNLTSIRRFRRDGDCGSSRGCERGVSARCRGGIVGRGVERCGAGAGGGRFRVGEAKAVAASRV